MAGGGQSWRPHHRTDVPHAVRQVRKMPYVRKQAPATARDPVHPKAGGRSYSDAKRPPQSRGAGVPVRRPHTRGTAPHTPVGGRGTSAR
ncbi:hypothetical protein EZV63_17275 [Streptomyces sp. VN1]|nr:hypothetical protein EZV63_17275 [Streptomyces sp. VN1]